MKTEFKTYNLDSAQGQRELRDFVGGLACGLFSQLGPGFTTHDYPQVPASQQLWREINIVPEALDQIEKGISALVTDMIFQQVKHFTPIPENPTLLVCSANYRVNGICFRVAIQRWPSPRIAIDYIGWK